jgi:hypothetical protein
MEHVLKFVKDSSCKGLRTLLIAMKIIDDEDLKKFLNDLKQAENTLQNRDANMALVYD